MLVDSTTKFKVFLLMDRFSRYNQIKMAPEDMEKTKFITPWGNFCYRMMSFLVEKRWCNVPEGYDNPIP